jgi:hypothetical protein
MAMEQSNIIETGSQGSGLYPVPGQDSPPDPLQKAFIVANTVEASCEEMRYKHIIPVFTKDNETLISHTDFIDITNDVIQSVFEQETISKPIVRLSHPIKGRIPGAKDKPANTLQEWEKTLYYERMMFIQEIPSIQETIDGNLLSLTVGGVKAYNQDNLYSRSLSDQHFKVFIGFQNRICTNLCVWTDGYMGEIKVKTIGQLKATIRSLIEGYNKNFHLFHLKKLTEYSITEQQFAHLVGRCRMYQHLPADIKSEILPILFGDQQIGTVVKDFYKDDSFCRDEHGNINLWRLYNLFTSANKSTYIDNFLDRSVNAFQFVEQIRMAVDNKTNCWYLN